MVVTLSIRSPDAALPSLSLDSPRIVLGRSRSSDVRIPDPSVSARHATIRQRGTEYLLMDEGSTNGTFVDGRRLNPGSPIILGRKSAVRVGRVWLDISLEQVIPSNNPAQLTREIALGLIAGALEAEGSPCAPRLVIRTGPSKGHELALAELKRVYAIGRGTDADLDVGDEDASRRHLEVTRRGGDVLVRDAGSKNGATLDGKPLVARKPVVIQLGQILRVGTTELELIDPLTETLKQLEEEPDEVMADNEQSTADQSSRGTVGSDHRASGVSGAVAPEAGTITTPAKHRPPVVNPPTQVGWTVTDLLVATLSVLVLGVSVAGIVWLFST